MDDMLLPIKRKGRLGRAVKKCLPLEGVFHCRACFIVGEKSETAPTECINFIRKSLDTRAGTIGSVVGALVGAFLA